MLSLSLLQQGQELLETDNSFCLYICPLRFTYFTRFRLHGPLMSWSGNWDRVIRTSQWVYFTVDSVLDFLIFSFRLCFNTIHPLLVHIYINVQLQPVEILNRNWMRDREKMYMFKAKDRTWHLVGPHRRRRSHEELFGSGSNPQKDDTVSDLRVVNT